MLLLFRVQGILISDSEPENVLKLFWPKVHPSRRIQPAAPVRANGRRQAIAALQDGWRRWPHTLRHIQPPTNSTKSFSGRIRMAEFESDLQPNSLQSKQPE